MRRRSGFLLLAALVLGFAGNLQPARAQDDADTDEEQPAQPRQTLFNSDELFERWFDQWAFGVRKVAINDRRVSTQVGGVAQLRELFDSQLDLKIRDLDRRYRLTDGQKKKLGLAGKRDIHRFFDAADEMKKRLRAAREDRAQFVAILNDRHRDFMNKRQGGENLFGEGSLLAKTLKTTLTNDRATKDAKDLYRSHIELVVSHFDEPFSLTEGQHRRFVTLIAEETPPLQRYGEYNVYAVMFQASRLPEARLARILEKGQMRLLHDRFLEAQTYEKVLIANGYLAGSGTDGSQPGAREGAKQKMLRTRIVRPTPIRRGVSGQD